MKLDDAACTGAGILLRTMMDARTMRKSDIAAWFVLMRKAFFLRGVVLKGLGYHNVAQGRRFNHEAERAPYSL